MSSTSNHVCHCIRSDMLAWPLTLAWTVDLVVSSIITFERILSARAWGVEGASMWLILTYIFYITQHYILYILYYTLQAVCFTLSTIYNTTLLYYNITYVLSIMHFFFKKNFVLSFLHLDFFIHFLVFCILPTGFYMIRTSI